MKQYTCPTAVAGRTLLSACLISLALVSCSSDDDDDGQDSLPTDLPGDNSGPASSPSPTIDLVPDGTAETALGTVYTTDGGLTLYTRYQDSPNTITCIDECATIWPPVLTDVTTTGISGQFDVIDRGDGNFQWMLDGYPLYSYSGDSNASETNGQGVDGEWAVARPLPIDSATLLDEEGLVAKTSTVTTAGDAATRNEYTGRTLYFFASDTAGESNCNDGCADTWPPLYADLGAVDRERYSVIVRIDGTSQWTYDGKALYFYGGDNAPGDTNGDGVGGVWSIARP